MSSEVIDMDWQTSTVAQSSAPWKQHLNQKKCFWVEQDQMLSFIKSQTCAQCHV